MFITGHLEVMKNLEYIDVQQNLCAALLDDLDILH